MHIINLSEGKTQIYHGLLLGIKHILATMYGSLGTTLTRQYRHQLEMIKLGVIPRDLYIVAKICVILRARPS